MAVRVLSLVLPVLLVFTVAVNTARKGTWAARNDVTNRILYGEPAYVGQFPHHAYVLAEDVNDGETYICSGTLISKRAVLTCAYCIRNYQKWTIRLGGIHRTEYEESAWTTVSPWALTHPEYSVESEYANLAIIFLVHEAPVSESINLVALPSSLEANITYHSKTGVISGWGFATPGNETYEEVLQWTEVTVIPNEICQKFHPDVDMTDKLCAANENYGATFGDLGAGLHLRTKTGFKLIGIFVRSIARNKTRPSVYTKVASYVDWINIKAPNSDYSLDN